MQMALLVGLTVAVVAAAACSGSTAPPCPERTDRFVKYELFMGRGGQQGEVVDDAAWAAFLDDTVTTRFPDGLTVLDAQGQWRDSAGLVQQERSKLLVIVATPCAASTRFRRSTSAGSTRSPCSGSFPTPVFRSPDAGRVAGGQSCATIFTVRVGR